MNKIFYTGTNFDLTNGIGHDYLKIYSVPNTPGYRFTMSKEVANFDSTLTDKSPYFRGENITPVKLDIKNPIYVDKNNESKSVPLNKKQILSIINTLPEEIIKSILNNFYGDIEYSGYKKILNEAVLSYTQMDTHYAIECLKNDFFTNYNEEDYLRLIKDNTQYDSIVKQEFQGHINVFVFTTNQVKSAIDNKVMTKTLPEPILTEKKENILNKPSQMEALIEEATKYKTFKEFKEDVFYHGTSEDIQGELRGGADNILWAATTNDIAQNYIAVSESSTSYHHPEGYELERTANVFNGKTSFDIRLLEQYGYIFTFTEDEDDSISSVTCTLNGREAKLPKKKDVARILTEELNYPPSSYMIIKNDMNGVAPYSYKTQGELYILLGKNKLKIKNKSVGYFNEENPQYFDMEGFRKSKSEGYDAVIIDDVAQSKNHDNVSHLGYALFETALEKLTTFSIPAVNFDWEDTFDVERTPEFCLKEVFDKSRVLLKNKIKSGITK